MTFTKPEARLLMYFESRAVEYGGTLESARMNDDDREIADLWCTSGFVQYGRIAFHDIKTTGGIATDHWCVLSDEAWVAAHHERRARCERLIETLNINRIGITLSDTADEQAADPPPANGR